eukprot:4669999-Pleurochrysis_carterae.AAC.1
MEACAGHGAGCLHRALCCAYALRSVGLRGARIATAAAAAVDSAVDSAVEAAWSVRAVRGCSASRARRSETSCSKRLATRFNART